MEVIQLKFRTAFKLYVVLVMLGLTALLVVTLSSCNKQIVDTTYTFNKAIIRLQDNSIVSGEIDSWKDYDGDQLQIRMKDGTTYLVHANNATLIHE